MTYINIIQPVYKTLKLKNYKKKYPLNQQLRNTKVKKVFFKNNSQSHHKIEMLTIKQQKHLLYFDKDKKCFSSFLFEIKEKQEAAEKRMKEQVQEQSESTVINSLINSNFTLADVMNFACTFCIQNSFTYKWQSQFYDIKVQQPWGQQPKLHRIPLSLETYFALYKNPQQWKLLFSLKDKYVNISKHQQKEILIKLFKNDYIIGKIIITSSFTHVRNKEPFKIGIKLNSQKDINQEGEKIVKIVSLVDNDTILCSGRLIQEEYCDKVENFSLPAQGTKIPQKSTFRICTFTINSRINTENICILKQALNVVEFEYNKVNIRIFSPQQPKFIPTLAKMLQSLRTMLEIQPLCILQDIETTIQAADGIVFYSDLVTLPQRIFRSLLFDKIQDKWLIQGMVSYSRSNKNFQDCISQLIQMMNQGQQFFPLVNDTYYFDEVWKAKARFFFYVLANFKTQLDYSSTLVGLILEFSQKKKVTSTYLFRRLKKKYGLDGTFRSIYEQQFIKSTGLNRIFYQLIDIRRDNSVKFIIRQKSLLNKFFKTYNLFRIRLEQAYGLVSPMMQRIIRKNKYDQTSSKRKDLPGSLAVPQFIKCLPFFRGKMTVESDACQSFQLELIEQNIMEKTKLSSSLRTRPAARKPGETDKGADGFTWMMIDTAYIFPAVYKNQNVQQSVILQRIKKIYQSQQEEIKVLNSISSTYHSQNQEICKALLQKLKMQPKTLNTTLSVKRKILQIIPIFINKLKDSTIWQDYYGLFQLYQPPCYDYSEDGYHFLTSLIQSCSLLVYKKQFFYYFNQLHRILLAILMNYQQNEQKELKLKILLYKSLMKWKSKYSFQILKNVHEALKMLAIDLRNNMGVIRIIIPDLMRFLDEVEEQAVAKVELIAQARALVVKCIQNDGSGQLHAVNFHYQLSKQQKLLQTIDFLRYAFNHLQSLQQNPQKRQHYWLSLKSFFKILQSNKIKYGLKIQIDQLNEDQSYFLAEYLWCKMSSIKSLTDSRVRLQWLKIYRVFYFYFTPIITIYKLKKALSNGQHNSQFTLSQQQLQELLTNCAELSFIPDIRWMSGYDSSAAKEQKAKYQQYNLQNNRRKRKFQELNFSQNNIITRFIRENPGKDNWQDITRQALRIIILIEQKKQVDNPQLADRYKKIVQGLKNVQNFLKRGNMPNDYSLQKVKIQAQYVLRQFQQDTQKLEQIFKMVEAAVESIRQQRRQKQIEKENEMKIFIPKDYMTNEDEDLNVQNTKSLHAIKEYPEEQGQDDERTIMRRIVDQEDKQNGEDAEIDVLGVQRYSSIFEQ